MLITRRNWILRDPDGKGGDPPPEKKDGNGAGEEKKFTQADVDRIAGETRQKGREAGVGDLLKELGFEKTDELKAIIKAHTDKENAEKSELQKTTEQLGKHQTRIGELESTLSDREGELAQLRLQVAIGGEVRKQKLNFVSAQAEEDAFDHLAREVETDEAGKPKNLDAALKQLAKDRPYLFGQPVQGSHGTPPPRGGRVPPPNEKENQHQERVLTL